jgi:hypothetical protein
VQGHAGPVTLDSGGWGWNLIESPDLGDEWKHYGDFLPPAYYLN